MVPDKARRLVLLFTLSLVAACELPAKVEPSDLVLTVAGDTTTPGCFTRVGEEQIRDLLTLEVQALGDFPASDTLIEVFRAGEADRVLDRFPDYEMLALVARLDDGTALHGTHLVGLPGEDASVLMLPLGQGCAVPGSMNLSQTARGAAIAALPDGGLVLFGGLSLGGNVGTSEALLVTTGETDSATIGRVVGMDAPPELGLADDRAGATATHSEGRVVIAGGVGIRPRDGEVPERARESFEIYDVATGELVSRHRFCPLGSPAGCSGRVDHGAARLPDGRVLVVGGWQRACAPASELQCEPSLTNCRNDAACMRDPRPECVTGACQCIDMRCERVCMVDSDCRPDVERCVGSPMLPAGILTCRPRVCDTDMDTLSTLSSAAIIDPQTGELDYDVGRLTRVDSREVEINLGRRRPQMVVLDDGNVLVVGGLGANNCPTGSTLWYDDVSRGFARLTDGVNFPVPVANGRGARAVAVALPGARMAWVGGADSIRVLMFGETPLSFAREDVELGRWPGAHGAALEDVRAVALADGRLFVTGRAGCDTSREVCDGACVETQSDPTRCGSCDNSCAAGEVCLDGECMTDCGMDRTNCDGACVDTQTSLDHCGACRGSGMACAADGALTRCVDGTCDAQAAEYHAFVIDLSQRTVEAMPPSGFAVEHLVPLADGTIAEIGTAGVVRRRIVTRTAFDHPPNTIGPEDTAWLARDAPGRWTGGEAGIRPCESVDCTFARLHVPTLRFADFEMMLDVEGTGVVRLRTPGAAGDLLVTHSATEVRTGFCELARAPGEEVRVERRGEDLILRTASAEQECPTEVAGRVAIAVDVLEGGVFRSMQLSRL